MQTRSKRHRVSLRILALLGLCALVPGRTLGAQPEAPVPADSDDPARDAWVLPDEMAGIYEQQ